MNLDKLFSFVDRQLIIDISKEAIEIPSPTGSEGEFARFFVNVLKDIGFNAHLQTIYEDRYNAVGKLKGNASGPTILFSGHMDTSVNGDEDYLTGIGFKNKAVIVDNRVIYGNGIFNMKSGLVCYVAALNALQRAGIKLGGDIIIAGTAGEIEKAAIDEYQGREYHGYGMGLRYLLLHGYAADYHILGEPTGMVPMVGQMGTVWAKITTHGTFSHTAFADSGINSIDEMVKLWNALEEWINEFRAKNIFMGVKPQINRAAIRGGLPWRAARTPNFCNMYLDIRFPPDQYPIDIQREFSEIVTELSKKVLKNPAEVEFYMSRPGTLLPSDNPVVNAVVDAHKQVTGFDETPKFTPPFCTDAIDANRFGIPTINYGPGGRARMNQEQGEIKQNHDVRSTEGEFVHIDDMVTTAQVYAVAAINLNKLSYSKIKTLRDPMPGVLK